MTHLQGTFFGIHIDKLKVCLEEESCIGTTLAKVVIIIFLYIYGIVLLTR
jgi:hypothetical protein